jgi:ribosome-interacting GTPase 1
VYGRIVQEEIVMPANLPPQYFEVEKKYREAKDLHEKIIYLQQLLSIIPKHKGTEKLQAELKTKISKLKDTINKQKKSKGSGGSWFQIEKQGAGQIVLVGLPNCGKSTCLDVLTNAHGDVGDYPFTTQLPQVGMLEYKDIKIQLVDTPPLYDESPPWLFGLYRNGDILIIVLDCTADVLKDFSVIRDALNERNIFVDKHEYGDIKKALVLFNKISEHDGETQARQFSEKFGDRLMTATLDTSDPNSIDRLKAVLFKQLKIIRVYTKKIGAVIKKDDPVILGKGSTVLDAAEHIHKDFKNKLKFARLWSDEGYAGQRVEKHHVLSDGDVIEFHV